MDLLKFYDELCKSLRLKLSEEKQVFLGEDLTPLMINKLPVFLPTFNNIKTAVSIDEEVTKVKFIYNPLEETVMGKDNLSFKKTIMIVEVRLLEAIYALGLELFKIGSNPKNKIENIHIDECMSMLANYKAVGTRKVIDNKTVEVWSKLFKAIVEKNHKMKYLTIYVKRGGTINGIKYNRITSISSPFIKELNRVIENDEDKLLGVAVNKKQLHTFSTFFKYIFEGNYDKLRKGKPILIGSLNGVAPAMHSLLDGYSKIFNRLNTLIEPILETDISESSEELLNIKDLPIPSDVLGDWITGVRKEIKLLGENEKELKVDNVDDTYTPSGINRLDKNNTLVNNNNQEEDFWDKANKIAMGGVAQQQPLGLPPGAKVISNPQQQIYQQPTNPWNQQQSAYQQQAYQQPNNPWNQQQQSTGLPPGARVVGVIR